MHDPDDTETMSPIKQPYRVISISYLLLFALLISHSGAWAGDKLVLQLKWFHQFQFAGYYAAAEKGFYADEGLEVEIRERNPNITPVDAVLSGDAQFGISDTSLVLSRLQGNPVVVLAAIYQHSPLVLISRKESGFIGPLDLKNKRVMYQANSDDATITATFMEFGLMPQDIDHVPHNFNDGALLTNKVDAMSAYVTNQPYYYKQRGVELNIISPTSYGIDFYGDMLFVDEDFLSNNPQTTSAFRRASLKGWEYALANPEEVVGWIKEKYQSKKTREHLLYEAEATRRMIQPDLIELGNINNNRFDRIVNIYKWLEMVPDSAQLTGINYRDYSYQPVVSSKWNIIIQTTLIASILLIGLSFVFNRRLKKMVKMRTLELEKSKQELERLSMTDALTGLGNRRSLDLFLKQQVANALRYNTPLSIIIFDLDHFKNINDNFGHSIGDQILQKLGTLIRERTREADLLGRWGGEEFMLICPETELSGAERLAEILRIAIATYNFSIPLPLRCSFGVGQLQPNEDAERFFSRADSALYEAKQAGRNRVICAA